MDDRLFPDGSSPPWRALVAGVCFIVAINAVAQRDWAIAILVLMVTVLAVLHRGVSN